MVVLEEVSVACPTCEHDTCSGKVGGVEGIGSGLEEREGQVLSDGQSQKSGIEGKTHASQLVAIQAPVCHPSTLPLDLPYPSSPPQPPL